MDDIAYGKFEGSLENDPVCGYTKVGDPLTIVLLPTSDAWIDILLNDVNMRLS